MFLAVATTLGMKDKKMLGPAELREIDEALSEERCEGVRAEKVNPYFTPQFALSMAMTRAAAAGFKPHFSAFQHKR
jgi:hypothetical protein